MAAPQKKLEQALEALKALRDKGSWLLLWDRNEEKQAENIYSTMGFIREFVRGWLVKD